VTQPGYETRDAAPKPLLWFAVGLTALCFVAAVASRSLERSWRARADAASAEHPMAAERTEPTAPLLQATTGVELAEHRVRELFLVEGCDWVDAENGIVRIPVATAMELLLERGLPVREGGGSR